MSSIATSKYFLFESYPKSYLSCRDGFHCPLLLYIDWFLLRYYSSHLWPVITEKSVSYWVFLCQPLGAQCCERVGFQCKTKQMVLTFLALTFWFCSLPSLRVSLDLGYIAQDINPVFKFCCEWERCIVSSCQLWENRSSFDAISFCSQRTADFVHARLCAN